MQSFTFDEFAKRVEEVFSHLNVFQWIGKKRVQQACTETMRKFFGDTESADELHFNVHRRVLDNPWADSDSEIIATWAVACLVKSRDHDITIYTDSMRSAWFMMTKVKEMLEESMKKFGGVFIRHGKEYVEFLTAEGFENSLHVYPLKEGSTRGTGCKKRIGTIIFDHFRFMEYSITTQVMKSVKTRSNVNIIIAGEGEIGVPIHALELNSRRYEYEES